MGQSPDGSRQFSQTEQAAYDHTAHPSRGEPDWSEKAVTSAKLMRSICRIADPARHFMIGLFMNFAVFIEIID